MLALRQKLSISCYKDIFHNAMGILFWVNVRFTTTERISMFYSSSSLHHAVFQFNFFKKHSSPHHWVYSRIQTYFSLRHSLLSVQENLSCSLDSYSFSSTASTTLASSAAPALHACHFALHSVSHSSSKPRFYLQPSPPAELATVNFNPLPSSLLHFSMIFRILSLKSSLVIMHCSKQQIKTLLILPEESSYILIKYAR